MANAFLSKINLKIHFKDNKKKRVSTHCLKLKNALNKLSVNIFKMNTQLSFHLILGNKRDWD